MSLEPIIDLHSASDVIKETYKITDEIRIGAQSPIKKDRYDPNEFVGFVTAIKCIARFSKTRFQVKNSMYKQADAFGGVYRDLCVRRLDEIREIYSVKSKEENHEK